MKVAFVSPNQSSQPEEFFYSEIEDWAKQEFQKKEAAFVASGIVDSISEQNHFYTNLLFESGYLLKNAFLLPHYYYGKQDENYCCFESNATSYEQLMWDYQDKTKLPSVAQKSERPFSYQSLHSMEDGWISRDGMLTPLVEKEYHHTIAPLILHQLLSSFSMIEPDFLTFLEKQSKISDFESYSYMVELYLQKRLGYWQLRTPGIYRGVPCKGHFVYSNLTASNPSSKVMIAYIKQHYASFYQWEDAYYPCLTEEEIEHSNQFLKKLKK